MYDMIEKEIRNQTNIVIRNDMSWFKKECFLRLFSNKTIALYICFYNL